MNDTSAAAMKIATWPLVLTAALIIMVTTGSRLSLGLFVSPLNTATGLGLVSISFAIAVGQFMWGASQPIFGAFADRYGSARVLMVGAILMAIGWSLTPLVHSQWMLVLTIGVLTAAGAGAGSFSILIGGTARRLPAEKRSMAGGLINAGGSFGQFVFAPLNQILIEAFGWVSAMYAMALASLATLPLARVFRHRPDDVVPTAGAPSAGVQAAPAGPTMREQVRAALRDRSYWCLHASFFTCGFHIAFLATHLPGEVNLCGLPAGVAATSIAIIGLANIAGSVGAGALGNRYRFKSLLFYVYFVRAIAIGLYLVAPKTSLTFYLFAGALGITWLSTVAPTAGLVGKLFGTRYLATLFGLTLLSHQTGAFFGAWLGGIALVNTGSYTWMWYADMALALFAAFANLPIVEKPVVPVRVATA
jgi:MFS family permease